MSDTYVTRVVDDELDLLLTGLPAIAVEGAKGVGKTETALRRARTARRLDRASELEVAAADPDRLLAGERPILLDEWQRFPYIWDLVRRAVDEGSDAGAFLLTGSAAGADVPLHSGAGRIASLRMRPMALAERGMATPTVSLERLLRGGKGEISGECLVDLAAYAREILRSGFPGMRELEPPLLRRQLDSYLARLADRDFIEIGHRVRDPESLRRWMVAYAAATATCASYETIRDAATGGEGDKPARSTTKPYRAALERLYLVEPLPGWMPTRSRIARVATAPKHHLADPALAARLLGIDVEALLDGDSSGPPMRRSGTLLGALFESLVTLGVRVYAQRAEARTSHFRTKAGEREVDLIVERGDGKVVAIEVKLSATVRDQDVRHLTWLQRQLGDDLLDAVVVTTGAEAYRRADGIAVVPAALLGP